MKKVYVKPNMEITELQLERMIAQSSINIQSASPAKTKSDTGFSMDDKDYDDSGDLW